MAKELMALVPPMSRPRGCLMCLLLMPGDGSEMYCQSNCGLSHMLPARPGVYVRRRYGPRLLLARALMSLGLLRGDSLGHSLTCRRRR